MEILRFGDLETWTSPHTPWALPKPVQAGGVGGRQRAASPTAYLAGYISANLAAKPTFCLTAWLAGYLPASQDCLTDILPDLPS